MNGHSVVPLIPILLRIFTNDYEQSGKWEVSLLPISLSSKPCCFSLTLTQWKRCPLSYHPWLCKFVAVWEPEANPAAGVGESKAVGQLQQAQVQHTLLLAAESLSPLLQCPLSTVRPHHPPVSKPSVFSSHWFCFTGIEVSLGVSGIRMFYAVPLQSKAGSAFGAWLPFL